jgi:hypothetical protein
VQLELQYQGEIGSKKDGSFNEVVEEITKVIKARMIERHWS